LILYIAKRSADDALFGATKLNKLLFFSFATGFELSSNGERRGTRPNRRERVEALRAALSDWPLTALKVPTLQRATLPVTVRGAG
jgi:hypothetical protein